MSEVISFRLDPKNPREAKALKVLMCRQEQGYSIRHILTETLLKSEQMEEECNIQRRMEEILMAIERISNQLERQVQVDDRFTSRPEGQPASISEAFMLSVKSAARPGLTLEG